MAFGDIAILIATEIKIKRMWTSAMLLFPTLLVLARALNNHPPPSPHRPRGAKTVRDLLPRTRIVGPVAIRDDGEGASSDPSSDGGIFRRRYVRPGAADDDDDNSAVVFAPSGIEGSNDWHASDGARVLTGRPHVRERAVCLNSIAHYEEMRATGGNEVGVPDRPATGENLLVGTEFNIDALCLGDVIVCDDLVGGVEFVVTHVRRPCQRWIKKYSKETFLRVMRRGLAGIFLAVRGRGGGGDGDEGEEGEGDAGGGPRGVLRVDGAVLRVTERKYPNWPLRRLNSLVYGRSGFDKKPLWLGTDEELEELIDIEELGMFQWKDYLLEVRASKKNPQQS